MLPAAAEPAEKEQNGETMNENELIEYVDRLCGLDLKGAVKSCQAVSRMNGRSYYIEAALKPDKVNVVTDSIHALFGTGTEPGNISLPKVNNAVCQGMREKNVKEAFLRFMKGDDGAKTKSLKLLIAADENENIYLYIF